MLCRGQEQHFWQLYIGSDGTKDEERFGTNIKTEQDFFPSRAGGGAREYSKKRGTGERVNLFYATSGEGNSSVWKR